MITPSDPVVIVSAIRTAIGNFQGAFKDTPATQLGATAIQHVVQQATIEPQLINEVIMGCVLPAGLGQAPARQAAIAAKLPVTVGATTVNKMCGSGMKATMLAYDALIAGSANIMIAGGMENMSRAPYLLLKARFGYRFGHGTVLDHMMLDGLEDAYEPGHQAMGIYAERSAHHYNIARAPQDAFAHASLTRAIEATQSGYFREEIAPVTITTREGTKIITEDEGPTAFTPDKIPKLKPVFAKDGTVTAANSSSISDGAAALLLMRQSQAKRLQLTPLATILGHYTHAQAPEWFTTAPIDAISGLLSHINWRTEDVDLFEINEAFAIVAMLAMQELNLPHDKINVHGGACALGHPIGASGARIIVTLLHAMQERNAKKGIAALCLGGGEAIAVALQR